MLPLEFWVVWQGPGRNKTAIYFYYLIASRIPPGQVLKSRVLLFGVVAGLVYLVVLVFLVRVLCCRRRGRLSRVSRLSR